MRAAKGDGKNTIKSALATTAVMLLFVAVLVVYHAMLFSETRQNIIKDCELSSVASAEQIDKYLSKGINTLKNTCFNLDIMIRAGKSRAEIKEYLVNQSMAVGYIAPENSTGIYGYIKEEFIDGSGWVPDSDYVPTERPWYIDARANVGRVAVVDPYVDAETGAVTITFSKTLCDAKSVAAMDFSTERLQTITELAASQGEATTEIVLDGRYKVISHSDRSEVGKSYLGETGTFGSALVENLRAAEGENGFISLRYQGAEYVVYYLTITNEWVCLSIFDATAVFSQLRNILIFTALSSLAVTALLLVILIRSRRKQARSDRMSHVVEALAAAIDAKDAYTNGHSGRVAEYAREIGRRYGYSRKKQEELYIMGLLHDVGKIGIPDAVINKPGRLTEEEMKIIKAHPIIGSDILSKTSDMPMFALGVRCHHERFDGTGYPDGLAGLEISEEARIIAVADAYDAMTSERSYRNALPPEVVRKEIEQGKGTQFDPVFADIMLQMMDKDQKTHGN